MFRYAPALLPVLADDFQPLIVRAHRERGTVMAGLLRSVAHLLTRAAR